MSAIITKILSTALLLSQPVDAGSVFNWSQQLWNVVSKVCVPGATFDLPFPCLSVDKTKGSAVLRIGPSRLLVVPTVRIEGIESALLRAPNAPNYWQAAWEARRYLRSSNPPDRPQVGLAVNSKRSRSQDQLHIHVSCVKASVRAALTSQQSAIDGQWRPLPFRFFSHRYLARRIDGVDLGDSNPFKMLPTTAAGLMADQTIVLIGTRFEDGREGFLLLNDNTQSSRANPAWGEELLGDCPPANWAPH